MTVDQKPNPLTPVAATPGQPLYKSVQDSLVGAIRSGHFHPGQRIPSTKELSRQLSVSLVTAHRALQELVADGFLERSQGRGTFVVERATAVAKRKFGLVLHREASMADYYHSQILEGMRQAGRDDAIDLLILQFGEQPREACDGFLLINPRAEEIEQFSQKTTRGVPRLVVGARSHLEDVCSVDVDNVDLARQAVEHLDRLGHRRIGYVGSADDLSNNRDRREGFRRTFKRLQLPQSERHTIDAASWRLSNDEKMALNRLLAGKDRPTALLAGGYYLALDVYAAVALNGLRIPQDISIVGVDDPPSAAHLSPPLTTLRQPLVQLGHSAVTILRDAIEHDRPMNDQTLRPELVIRESSSAPAKL